MKKYIRFTGFTVLILVMVIAVQSTFAGNIIGGANTIFAAAEQQVKVTLNGYEITFPDAQPFIDANDRTLVPIRFIAEAMGGTVTWADATETATIVKGSKTITLKIGDYGSTVNGQRWALDTCALLKEDRTFVPLRFVSEIIGATVKWDESTNTVSITDSTNAYLPTPTPKINTTPKVTPTPTPTSSNGSSSNYTTPIFTPTYHTPEHNATSTPTPNPIPSVSNPIMGNPYYGNGISNASDLSRYTKFQALFNYDDVISIMGDSTGKDDTYVSVNYGWYNPIHKKVEGYLSVEASETYTEFNFNISQYSTDNLNRLREVINIAINTSDQNLKDSVYNSMISCKDGFTGGTVEYDTTNYYFIRYDHSEALIANYGENSFDVTAWGSVK